MTASAQQVVQTNHAKTGASKSWSRISDLLLTELIQQSTLETTSNEPAGSICLEAYKLPAGQN